MRLGLSLNESAIELNGINLAKLFEDLLGD
jgi:hypothetical protein